MNCFTAYEATFLLQQAGTEDCLYQADKKMFNYMFKLVARSKYGKCNEKSGNFRWLWTKFGQLLHWKTLECMSNEKWNSKIYCVALQKCERYHDHNSTQLWECAGSNIKYIRRWLVRHKKYAYIDYGRFNDYVTTKISWKGSALGMRYDNTQKDVCSQGKFEPPVHNNN